MSQLGRVILVGTAHVWHESIKKVEKAVMENQPCVVAVEIDEARLETLRRRVRFGSPRRTANGFFPSVLAHLFMFVQQRLGRQLGVIPGSEMLAAVEVAKRLGSSVALVDRPIWITMKRLVKLMSIREKIRLLSELLLALIPLPPMGWDLPMEKITDEPFVRDLTEQIKVEYPTIYRVLVEERDAYIAHQLLKILETTSNEHKIVVVVGAGHKPGIQKYLEHPEKLPRLKDLISV